MTSLAGSVFKIEEDHLRYIKVGALICCNANISFNIYGNMCSKKQHPIGMASLKNLTVNSYALNSVQSFRHLQM